MKLGFLYAGQGSQHPGMGADLYKAFPTFRAVLDSAAEQVDFDLKEISFTDTKGILNQTRYTQPCMVAFAAGMTALLAERDIVPAAAAGLSLGEYSALHAAGVFDADTAVELVAFRGKAMEDAAAGRPSAMVAVLGLDRAALQEACDEASAHGCVVIANYNCPGQLVLGGEKAAVETAAALAKEKGARRCLPLTFSGRQRPLPHPPHGPRRGRSGGAVPHRGVPGVADPRDLQLSGRGASRRRCHPGAAGAAGAEQRLHGGFPPPHGRHGAGRAGGDRPGQGPQRLCEENRPGAAGVRRGDRGGAGTADGDPQRSIAMNFSEKTAVVTGGSRGLGRAICLELARGGANVVLCYAGNEAAANETVAACESLGAKTVAIRCDVSKEDEVKALMDAALKTFGRIDILVNNAGITRDGLLMMMKPEDFDAVIAANLRGAFLCMKAVARQMVKQRYGRIVNLSSVVGLRGNAGQVNYAASKAGVIGMTKSLAKELAGRNITVNAVAPGFIDTDMTAALSETAKNAALGSIPMGRMGTPENVAKAVAFLADEDAGYITGQVLAVDGGMSM